MTAIRRDVHVGGDRSDAWRVVDPIVAQGYRGMPREALVVGGTAEVGQALGELGDLGFSHVLVRHLADDQQEVLASYERLAVVRFDLDGG